MKNKKIKQVNDYVIDINDLLGAGGFSSVYKCKNKKTNKEYAVKCIKCKILNDQYLLNALKNQIKTLYRLTSENTVRLVDICKTSNNIYIVQELCDGDLAEYVKSRKGRLPEEQVIDIMVQILKGFYQLILIGVVHRDLKPQNIFYKDKTFKIADFGLSINLKKNSLLKSNVGTQAFQSPQQILGKKYNYKCDIFALGLIFYSMLYGKTPTADFSYKEWADAIADAENGKQIQLHFPQSVPVQQQTKELIKKCLKVRQQDRADWQYLFQNSIFKGRLPSVSSHKNQLNYIIREINNCVAEGNIDLQIFFQRFKKKYQKKSLNLRQFSKLLHHLAPLTIQDMKYIFLYFDQNNDGEIQLSQFEHTLNNHVDYHSVSRNIFAQSVILPQKNQGQQAIKQQKRNILVEKAYEKFIKAGLQQKIYTFPEKYEGIFNQKNGVNQKEFHSILLQLSDKIQQEQSLALFEQFDENKDKSISYEEFYNYLCKVVGAVPEKKQNTSEKQFVKNEQNKE